MERRRFRYLPHTADIAFVAYGDSFKALIENSALATIGLMFDTKAIRKEKGTVKTARITERARSREDALWFILQDIVSKVDQKKLNAFSFKVNRLSEKEDAITIRGCIFYKRVKRYVALLDVKAVTPHTLEVKRSGRGYRAHVLVDV